MSEPGTTARLINPAFRWRWQLWGFAALLAALTGLTFAAPHFVPRERCYRSIHLRAGDYFFQAREFFETTGEIDFVFLGSSTDWAYMDHAAFRASYKQAAGRDVTTLTVAGNWRAEDILYLQFLDLVRRRKVGTLMLSMPVGVVDGPHNASKYLWDLLDPDHRRVFAALQPQMQFKVFSENLIALPRLLWALVSKPGRDRGGRPNTAANYGGILYEVGYLDASGARRELTDRALPRPEAKLERFLFTGAESERIKIGAPLSHWERTFHEAILRVAREYGVRVIYIQPPIAGTYDAVSYVRRFEGDLAALPILTFPLPDTFPGADLAAVQDHYYDPSHMNKFGAALMGELTAKLLAQMEIGATKE